MAQFTAKIAGMLALFAIAAGRERKRRRSSTPRAGCSSPTAWSSAEPGNDDGGDARDLYDKLEQRLLPLLHSYALGDEA